MSSLSSNGQLSTRSGQASSGDRTTAQLSDIRQKQLSYVLYWRFLVNLALMLIDAAMYTIVGATVLNLRYEATPFYSDRFNPMIDSTVYFMIMACFWVWSLHVADIYYRHAMGDGYQFNVLLAKGMVVCWVAQCVFNYLFNLGLTLTSLCLVVIAGWLLTIAERIASRALTTCNHNKSAYTYGTVTIGSPHGTGHALKFLGQCRQLNYHPVAVCPIHLSPDTGPTERSTDHETFREEMQKNEGYRLPVLEYSDYNLAEQTIDMNVQTVIAADELHHYSDNYDVFSARMGSFGLEIAVPASAANTSNHKIQVRSIQDTTVIMQRLAQYTPAHRLTKRLFDLVISSLAIICSLIIIIPVAIVIKVTDGGSVFYKQTRMGLCGKPFQMYKFRSMVVNVDALEKELARETGQTDRFIFKMKNGPRITKVGHPIRRFSIDGLSQFLNMWMGDMSVVGPRPPLPGEYTRYNRLYATRMLVKPGITGPWQASGRPDLSAEEGEALDTVYVQNWSIMGDTVLLSRAVGAVLSYKGAY